MQLRLRHPIQPYTLPETVMEVEFTPYKSREDCSLPSRHVPRNHGLFQPQSRRLHLTESEIQAPIPHFEKLFENLKADVMRWARRAQRSYAELPPPTPCDHRVMRIIANRGKDSSQAKAA